MTNTQEQAASNTETGRILNVFKPLGWSSNDVIRFLKHRFPGKVGHAGTLDPFADGVLLVCLGKATKQVSQLMDLEKQYVATIEFGVETDTLDVSGNILKSDPRFTLKSDRLHDVVRSLIGEIEQTPPDYSAVHVNGQRAYQLAREGKSVTLQSRTVTISDMSVKHSSGNRAVLSITCSKGTYIRSLARDIARQLGTVGYLKKLSRIRIGDYVIENSVALTNLDS